MKSVGPNWLRSWSRVIRRLCGDGERTSPRQPDVPFQPTPQRAVEQMLRLARVHNGDVLYDLGSGDGRIVITACRLHRARGVGIDIDRRKIERSLRRAREEGVADRVAFRNEDFFDTNISEATVVALFLWPEVTNALQAKFVHELKPGTRVVSYFWEIGDWEPDTEIAVDGRPIYLWTMPPRRCPNSPIS